MNRIIIFIIMLLFLSACQSAKDAFTLKKRNNADEFLVEKKSPLVVPPEFGKLPTPGGNKDDTVLFKNDPIKDLIGNSKKNSSTKKKIKSKSGSIESLILEKIK